MNSSRMWRSGSRRLAILLLAVVVPPAATLVWLGTQLLEQDRALATQRETERRQAAGQAIALSLEQSLSAAERLFSGESLPDGVIRFALSPAGIDATPANRTLWLPVPRAFTPAESDPFADAERFEYQGEPARALNAYVDFARSPNRAIRAGALLRSARVHRRERRWDAALDAYLALAGIRDVAISGMPADLLARRAACAVLEEAGRTERLARAAVDLEQDLLAGAWVLDRAAWELTVRDIERWRGRPVDIPAEGRLFSSVADALWEEARADPIREVRGASRRLVVADGVPVTVVVRASANGANLLAISPAVLQAWTISALAAVRPSGTRLAILAPSGEFMTGGEPPAASSAMKLAASETGLPWTLALDSVGTSLADEEFAGRRRLLATGLAAILLLLAGGSYFLWRVVQRELAVVRLQTDFVSAVSHEFRTPLTALRHITELLEEDDDLPKERRRAFYDVFSRNTGRLHQLVESLLDFARMEEGRKPYDRRPVDAVEFTRRVVTEFLGQGASRGSTIEVDAGASEGLLLHADVAALTNALWNLLDNAVKYSPDSRPVHVSVHPHSSGVAIAVRDEGFGIDRHERQAIFQRFVRGKQAIELGIKGTGLGLAMVAHIARAHGGSVEVESEEGQGSTFRIVLPAFAANSQLPIPNSQRVVATVGRVPRSGPAEREA